MSLEPFVPSITGDGLFAVEMRLLALAILAAFAFPRLGADKFRHAEEWFGALARRRALSVIVVGLACIALRLALLPILPVPTPAIADEFSYLLQADTFAHGRLANPTPPLWEHFDTFHVIFHPTYASKYPPMQGVFLAAGQVFLGHPWFGVLLSAALMGAALCWMLQGWLPPGWALLGGLIAVVRVGTFSYWMNSYWGGSVAALGGLLVLGALPRILRRRKPLVRNALWMGLGLAILANSRPFEGLLLSLPVAAILLWRLGRGRISPSSFVRRVAVPLAICLALTAAAMCYYDWRVTGSALTMPYQVHLETRWRSPLFIWQRVGPLAASEPDRFIQRFRDPAELTPYYKMHSVTGFLRTALSRAIVVDSFFLGPILTLPLVMLPWALRDRRVRPLVWIGTATAAGLMCEVYFSPHYVAPATGLMYVLLLQCLRHLRAWSLRRRPVGLMLVRAVPAICVIMLLVRLNTGSSTAWAWYADWPGNLRRAQVEEKLDKLPGQQLVILRYMVNHPTEEEWVYNGADFATAKIIWSADEGDESNRELIAHFPGRCVWLLEPDKNPVKLSPYSAIASNEQVTGNQ